MPKVLRAKVMVVLLRSLRTAKTVASVGMAKLLRTKMVVMLLSP